MLALSGTILLTAGCEGIASTLDPHGPRAAQEAELWWIMLALSSLVYVVVLGSLFYAIWRRRPREGEEGPLLASEEEGGINSTLLIVGGGIVIPLIILPIIWVLTLRTMARLAAPPSPPVLTIEIVGHRWWYEVRYPEQGITLVNDMRIPAGQVVQWRITSADVIHSYWVPRLSGKVDMVPGMVNEHWVLAEHPGRYFVECAEFCGLWHAKMQMWIVAEPPVQFAQWLASQRR